MTKLNLFLFLVIFIGVFKTIIAQKDSLMGKNWILIENTYDSKPAVFTSKSLYTFKDSIFISRNVFDTTNTLKRCQVNDSILIFDDTSYSEINFLSQDSLKITSSNNKTSLYVVAKNSQNHNELNNKYFLENDWILLIDSIIHHIYFQNQKNDFVKRYFVYDEYDKHFIFQTERWSLIDFNNAKFLSLSWNEHCIHVLQILEINEDTIITCTWDQNKVIYPMLIRKKNIDIEKRNKIIKVLTSNQWTTNNVIYYSLAYYEMPTSRDISQRYHKDTLLISQNDFFKKKISYRFHNNMKYEILVNNKVFSIGSWKLSLDGEVVVLNKGKSISNYLKIIDINEDSLIIEKYDVFCAGKKNEFKEYYYKIEMK